MRGYVEPLGEVEQALAQIWQELLGVERVGRHDHFFELGGHSLMIVSLIERLRVLGRRLDVQQVFASPVLADLAQAMGQGASQAPAWVTPPNLIEAGCSEITPEMLPLVALSQGEIETIVNAIPGGASNVQDIYPLAPLQEGILFHHLLQEQGDAYVLRSVLAFDSRARVEGFVAALQQVIARHDILRTSFAWQGLSKPVQVVWREAQVKLNTFEPTQEAQVQAQLLAHTDPSRHRLPLNSAPLFALDMAHDPVAQEWLLAVRFHHLVGDHSTMEFIVDEVAAILQGHAQDLPEALPYRDFIAQTLSVPTEIHEAYFRKELADVNEPTAPFGELAVQGGGSISEANLHLEAALAEGIRSQARRLGVSPGVLFHAGWAQVLAQLSGKDDVVFGTVLLGRLQGSAGADRVLGMFINTLPVRVKLAGRSVQEVVQATYQGLMSLLEHEQAPLVLAQRCSSVAAGVPLFSALLNYRHSQAGEAEQAQSWEGMRLISAQERTNYPVSLSVDDLGEGFGVSAQTVEGIDPARVTAYLVTAMQALVQALAEQPQRAMLSLPVLPQTEREQVLVGFNATQAEYPQQALIQELFEAQVKRSPQATALV
ncbi:condensation domain-containing protein, partial [Pelomonas sp. P7]